MSAASRRLQNACDAGDALDATYDAAATALAAARAILPDLPDAQAV